MNTIQFAQKLEDGNFSLLYRVRADSGIRPSFFPVGSGAISPGA